MKSGKKADDLLREKLNSYASPVPAGLFEAMDKKRQEQQSKRVLGWTMTVGLSAVVLLLLAGFAYWQMNEAKETKADNTTITEQEQVAISTLKEDITEEETTIAQLEVKAQKNINNQALKKQEKENISTKSTQQRTNLNDSSVSFSTQTESVSAKEPNVFERAGSTENSMADTQNSSDNTTIKQTKSIENSVSPSVNVAFDEAENKTNIADQKIGQASVLINPLKSKDFFDQKYHAAMPRIECGWEARKVYIYFDAITSVDMAFRTLSPKLDDGESDAYAILRNQTEGMQESLSLGFRASAVTRGGFAMRTGLIYSNIKEPFSQRFYTDFEEYIETTNEQGEVLSRDTIIRTEVQEYNFTNRHKLLDVPLIIGYEIDKYKYNIGLNAGAYLNITASQEGRFLNTNSEIVNFSTNSPERYDAFKTNVGMSLYGSIAVNYKITPAFHFIFEPYGRYYMNSFTTEAHELDQNYLVAGMQVGLRMKM